MLNKWMTYLGSLIVIAALLTTVGCDFGPKTIEVEGTVTLDGTPLVGAEVVYTPLDITATTGSCYTDASGSYNIVYPGDGNMGVPAGDYIVSVSDGESDPDSTGPPLDIPAKYQGENSELKITVPSSDGTYDLVLTSD